MLAILTVLKVANTDKGGFYCDRIEMVCLHLVLVYDKPAMYLDKYYMDRGREGINVYTLNI